MSHNITDYETVKYLSTKEAAEHLGITRQAFHHRQPPKPNVIIGNTPGWSIEVIEDWNREYTSIERRGRKKGQKP